MEPCPVPQATDPQLGLTRSSSPAIPGHTASSHPGAPVTPLTLCHKLRLHSVMKKNPSPHLLTELLLG
jgi:hypothetical protein